MNNEFTKETFALFDQGGYSRCWESGRNDSDALHHILGRVSNSPYNAAPINNRRSHMPEGRKGLMPIHSEPVRRRYLLATKLYLDSVGYEPNNEDRAFLEKYKEYYTVDYSSRRPPENA